MKIDVVVSIENWVSWCRFFCRCCCLCTISRRCKFSDVEGVKLESIMLVKLLCALHCTGKLARKASKERKNKVLKVRGKAKTEVRSGKAVAKKKKD